jgi:hypothetical protein
LVFVGQLLVTVGSASASSAMWRVWAHSAGLGT